MKTFANSLLDHLSPDMLDTFDSELFAEWFIAGDITEANLHVLTNVQIDAVANNILKRWGEAECDAFDAVALRYVKV